MTIALMMMVGNGIESRQMHGAIVGMISAVVTVMASPGGKLENGDAHMAVAVMMVKASERRRDKCQRHHQSHKLYVHRPSVHIDAKLIKNR